MQSLPIPTGIYPTDTWQGRRAAERFLSEDNPARLGHIVAGLLERGHPLSGVEIGFLHRISESAILHHRWQTVSEGGSVGQ